MELNKQAPKFTNKEGEDEKLSEELKHALNRELEKSPDEIDTQKIDSIIMLLNQLEPSSEKRTDISKEEFAQKYLSECKVGPLKKGTDNRVHYRSRKVAVAFVAIFLMFSICNYISVKATSKNVFTNIKEKVYILYFDVMGSYTRDNENVEDIGDMQEVVGIEEETYESWDELGQTLNVSFKIPYYIPEGLEPQKIHVQKSGEKDIGISRQYLKENTNITILMRTVGENGKWLSATDQLESLTEKKELNGFEVSFYQVDDALQAVFQDKQFIYVIETNVGQEELERIIVEMQ